MGAAEINEFRKETKKPIYLLEEQVWGPKGVMQTAYDVLDSNRQRHILREAVRRKTCGRREKGKAAAEGMEPASSRPKTGISRVGDDQGPLRPSIGDVVEASRPKGGT